MNNHQLIASSAIFIAGALTAAAAVLAAKLIPRWPTTEKVHESKIEDPLALEKNNELTRNLVSLWIAQNAVVWGRLTVIAALQTAVYAGWFTLFDRERYFWSLLVAVIGSCLAWAAYVLIDCDLKWKYAFSEKLKAADPRLLPTGIPSVQGWKVMRGLVIGFYVLNVVLVAVSAIHWLTLVGCTFVCEK